MRAALNDRTITRCRLMVPAWGLPFAEVEIDGRDELEDNAVTLRLSDLEASMTVMASGSWRGRRRYRLVGGSGGWAEQMEARGYSSDLKVLRAKVAADAAAEAGELIDTAGLSADSLGGHWTRPAGPAARTLELLAPRRWRVGLDGFTRFGPPTEVEYTGDATRVDLPDRAVGRVELAPQQGSVAALVPGAVVDGTVAVDVEHRVSGGALRTSLWAAHGASSRLLSALGRLVRQLTARYDFAGAYSYRVVAQDGDRLDLQPERSSTGMPWLQRVRPRYFPGLRVEHVLGSLVVVQFLDSDPARPVVTGGDDPESAAWLPQELSFEADGDASIDGATVRAGAGWAPVVRQGDKIEGIVVPGATGSIVVTTLTRADLAPPTKVFA